MGVLAVTDHAMNDSGRYVYALIEGEPPDTLDGYQGIDDQPLELIRAGAISAVCSAFGQTSISPRRKYLSAHAAVLELLREASAALPMKFGMLADSRASVRAILATHQCELVQSFHRIRGKLEMSIKIRPAAGTDLFGFILASSPALVNLRDRIADMPEQARYVYKIELGRQFEKALAAQRQMLIEKIRPLISGVCDELLIDTSAQVRHLLGITCLVNRASVQRFNDDLALIAHHLDEDLCVEISDPWLPSHFSDVSLFMEVSDVHS